MKSNKTLGKIYREAKDISGHCRKKITITEVKGREILGKVEWALLPSPSIRVQ